ncbi:NEDD4-binding protein 1-like isoform X2 [Phymastichus coffea]|uniref:NEDD4-binding protein 1-like isoform X2 n=1 Tax=Phymastichus coffea TaxID=108790 RepID=UPI00273B0BBC|nr:NEDD4-binding protein 1-like isoform X2 [Phymastichus coffea]
MAKTRKINVRTPVKNRKSTVIKKSPVISRKRAKSQVQKSRNKNIKTFLYESPLKHLRHNGERSNAEVQSEDTKVKEVGNVSEHDKNEIKINLNNEIESKIGANTNEQAVATSSSIPIKTKRKEENLSTFMGADSFQVKKKKLNKSPLSRIRDVDQPVTAKLSNKLDESIICVDDLDIDAANDNSIETQVNSQDIVVIDDSFSQSSSKTCLQTVCKHANLAHNLLDSVIVLDDEPQITKPTEDCMVVWSSLPEIPTTLISSKPINENDDLLKSDKILLDTTGEPSNLRYLKNDNSNKKLAKKSPKVTKFGVKKLNTKKVSEITRGLAKTKIVTKTVSKVTKLPVKKKSKGELIFSAQNTESKCQKKSDDSKPKKGTLREIVIDGSNVAMAYTNNKTFSEKGIKMLIDYFTKKGHTVKVFVPQYRRSRNHVLLEKWYEEGIVVFTPSRKLGNKFITSYDDRYILEYARACNGIVVSQDQFRDLYAEKVEYRDTIEKRLLIPTFVGDYVMFPEDPLGRSGPSLAEFLKH